jgi:Rhodopirellula transposase DDE domain
VEEDRAALQITLGSSYKPSAFIVDTLEAKWDAWDAPEKAETSLLQINMANGPESSGRRTQLLYRMVQFADLLHQPIQLL